MKNILFTLFAILILTSCSKDDDNWIELNENNIVGNWSTGIKGSHKFLNFGDDDKGSFGIYSNVQIPFLSNVQIQSKIVRFTSMMYSQRVSQ